MAVSRRPHVTADAVAGLIRRVRRIQAAGSPALFEDRVGDNHHHLICRSCGRVVDIDCAIRSAPCLEALDDKGYEIDEAEVAYSGRCPDCRPGIVTTPAAQDSHEKVEVTSWIPNRSARSRATDPIGTGGRTS